VEDVAFIELANGVRMPTLGLGTSPMADAEAEVAVAEAIGLGYRLIDTAEKYGNERGVGRGIRASGVPRRELFIATKFNAEWHGVDRVRLAWAKAVDRLDLDHVDLLLIHWPNPGQDRFVEAWEGLLALLERGLVRAVGVSNFKPAHLDRLIDSTGVAPHVNQIQLNPRLARVSERKFHGDHGIRTMSWSPLGGAGSDLLGQSPVLAIAERHGRTPAQVVLRWHVQQGLVPVPKSIHPRRMAENMDVFGFELDSREVQAISDLDGTGEPPYDSDAVGN
jgi:2,5-diketo-D-gluconate reductase A